MTDATIAHMQAGENENAPVCFDIIPDCRGGTGAA
jgi:hypothetical protein